MIRLTNIDVKFNMGTVLEKHALKNLSLNICEGEFLTVIGSNGAGKSTLLGTLCGDVSPLAGTVEMDGVDVTSWPSWKRALMVARVFQDPMAGTCAHLSIEENLALAFNRGKKRSFQRALSRDKKTLFIEHIKRLGLGLEDRLRNPMGSLSGGQRQAVSLIMAALTPMKILVLDEHTAALDPKTAHFVMELTQHIIAENKLTALMVTHSMAQALAVGTRTLMLCDGQVAYDVSGKERQTLTVQDLLDLFHARHINDDELLLG